MERDLSGVVNRLGARSLHDRTVCQILLFRRRVEISARLWIRFAQRRVSPACSFALGLWAGLTFARFTPGAVGLVMISFALVAGALAMSLSALAPENGAAGLILAGALCCGLAMAGAVVRYQAQRAWPGEDAVGFRMRLFALEGVLAIDSAATAKGNRRLDIGVRAAEWEGVGYRIRNEWGRGVFAAQIITGPIGQVRAGTVLRAASLRSGDFVWADMRSVLEIRGAGSIVAIRGWLADQFADALRSCAGRAGPLAQALLLGVKDELDGEYRALFQSAGCAHLLALSGQHLAIICAFIALLGKRISRRAPAVRRVSFGFAWIFVWLAGPGPSLLRAVFMLSVAEIARALDRPQTAFSVLSLASVLLALFSPSSINSLSSVYSFSAMAGLIALSMKFSALLRPWLPKPVADGLAASIAAVCATAPVSIIAFGSFVPAGILSATAAAPVMLAFMWIALGGSIVVMVLPWAALITRPVLEFLEGALISVLNLGAWFPTVQIGGRPLALVFAIGLIALIVALIYAVPRMRQRTSRAFLERARSRLPCADAKSCLALLGAREKCAQSR